jgi:hypothetical protein
MIILGDEIVYVGQDLGRRSSDVFEVTHHWFTLHGGFPLVRFVDKFVEEVLDERVDLYGATF